jgi:hypothetical protein
MTATVEPTVPITPRRAAIAVGLGLAAGLLLVLGPYLVFWSLRGGPMASSWSSVSGFNNSLTLLFPIVQGVAMALALGRVKRDFGVVVALAGTLTVIEIVGSAVILREGVICLIILSPLIFGMVLTGALVGRWLARLNTKPALHASLAPLIVLAVFAESTGPRPDFSAVVSDEVIVDAPPEYVWRYIVSYPENQAPPEYWLWSVGLPKPIQSVADAPEVGATRLCVFDGGIAFEERITELVENEVMTFDVTAQPNHPEVIGHFQFDRGQIRLTRNADGTTTVTATSWYRLFVRPAAYFNWWTEDITRQVHFRVLNHVKGLAETDYAAAQDS